MTNSHRAGRFANPLGVSGKVTKGPKFSKNVKAKLKRQALPGKLLTSRAASRKRYVQFRLIESENLRALAEELNAEGWSFDGERWTEEKLLCIRKGYRRRR